MITMIFTCGTFRIIELIFRHPPWAYQLYYFIIVKHASLLFLVAMQEPYFAYGYENINQVAALKEWQRVHYHSGSYIMAKNTIVWQVTLGSGLSDLALPASPVPLITVDLRLAAMLGELICYGAVGWDVVICQAAGCCTQHMRRQVSVSWPVFSIHNKKHCYFR